MKKVLLTGGTGFIGRSILPILGRECSVDAPSRHELDIIDSQSVHDYFLSKRYDVVIHCANINPYRNPQNDKQENMFEYTLRGFFNIEREKKSYDKLFYIGSGAEYDKRKDISFVKEGNIGESIPHDPYGFAKYILNDKARSSTNIYNLRIFGCYGPTDAKGKFIRDAIDCCFEGKAVSIRQNCLFDYMYVDDLGEIILRIINTPLAYHDYNICSGRRIALEDIAKIVAKQMGNPKKIEILKPGWNKEYTADNSRILSEIKDFNFTSLEEGISRQIAWQRTIGNEEKNRGYYF